MTEDTMEAVAEAFKEADITINGVRLSHGQAMTLRVAASSFFQTLEDDLGGDEMGRKMAKAYRYRLTEIFRLMQV